MSEEIIKEETLPLVQEVIEIPSKETRLEPEIIHSLSDYIVPKGALLVQMRHQEVSIYDYDTLTSRKVSFYPNESPSGALHFDKNMSPILVSKKDMKYDREKYKFPIVYKGVSSNYVHEDVPLRWTLTIIVDKEKLLVSKELEVLAMTEDVSERDIDNIRTRFIDSLGRLKQRVDNAKSVLSSLYKEEDYEIITSYIPKHFNSQSTSLGDYEHALLTIYVLHHDITITNSLEDHHYIGDIAVAMEMYTTNSPEEFYISRRTLYGTRITYTPYDACQSYGHSHLSPAGLNLGHCTTDFCIGHENHMFSFLDATRNNHRKISMLELEGILLATEEYVSWESLEGGPHKKMEAIHAAGKVIPIQKDFSSDYNVPLPQVRKVRRFLRKKLPQLKHLFYIENVEGKQRFNVNKMAFLTKVLEITTVDEIRKITPIEPLTSTRRRRRHFDPDDIDNDMNTHSGTYYFYNSELGQFVQSSGSSNWKEIKREAKQKVSGMQPLYINGRFVAPTIIKEDEKPDYFDSRVSCLSPYLLLRILSEILYELNLTLEDEYRNKN